MSLRFISPTVSENIHILSGNWYFSLKYFFKEKYQFPECIKIDKENTHFISSHRCVDNMYQDHQLITCDCLLWLRLPAMQTHSRRAAVWTCAVTSAFISMDDWPQHSSSALTSGHFSWMTSIMSSVKSPWMIISSSAVTEAPQENFWAKNRWASLRSMSAWVRAGGALTTTKREEKSAGAAQN